MLSFEATNCEATEIARILWSERKLENALLRVLRDVLLRNTVDDLRGENLNVGG